MSVAGGVPSDLVTVARVIDAYGVHGWLKLEPFSADAGALHAAQRWWVRRLDGSICAMTRVASRPHSGTVVAQLAEVGDRTAAEALRGAEIAISRVEFPAPREGEFYWVDLIGCAVDMVDGKRLGLVENVMENGAHAILDVGVGERGGKQMHELIPFVAAYVVDVDIGARRVVVDWQLE